MAGFFLTLENLLDPRILLNLEPHEVREACEEIGEQGWDGTDLIGIQNTYDAIRAEFPDPRGISRIGYWKLVLEVGANQHHPNYQLTAAEIRRLKREMLAHRRNMMNFIRQVAPDEPFPPRAFHVIVDSRCNDLIREANNVAEQQP